MNQAEPHTQILTDHTPFYKRDDKKPWHSFRDIFGGAYGITLRLDEYGQVDELQTALQRGDIIRIVRNTQGNIIQVEIPGLEGTYYTDNRFIDESNPASKRNIVLPEKANIIQRLISTEGTPYIWGGTQPEGFPKLLELYPPSSYIDDKTKTKWIAAGLDCSGLLFYATNGYSPRNTNQLCRFGSTVNIENVSSNTAQMVGALMSRIEPLDIIVWPGHVMIVLDKDRLIESRLYFHHQGDRLIVEEDKSHVQILSLQETLARTIEQDGRRPVNEITDTAGQFLVRRWYS
jgi:hypothetical protein